jgi:AGZA family xanthine/uracil permease-like MFS transporter
MMIGAIAEIEWSDPDTAIPAFLTVVGIPLTFSIANGLAFGLVAHAVLRIARGRARRAEWMLYVLAALFVARFATLATG